MKSTKAVGSIDAAARLHFGLLDLPAHFGRRYGGAGVMIDAPTTIVRWQSSSAVLEVTSEESLDIQTSSQIDSLLRGIATHGRTRLTGRVNISSRPPSHRGYGTGTSLLLAVAEAVQNANGLDLSMPFLADLTGRGGASGVGVHGYRMGGLLLDAGHGSEAPVGPSSVGRKGGLPLLISHNMFPETWRIGLLNPSKGHVLSREDEIQLFANAVSLITRSEVGESIAAAYHQLLPGVINTNFALFRLGLHTMQSNAFKRIEIQSQHKDIGEILWSLRAHDGVACGMSSVGPLVFAVYQEFDADARIHIDTVSKQFQSGLCWTRARNGPRVVTKWPSD